MVGAFKKLEDDMRLITRFELATRNLAELQLLYREIFNRLAASDAGTPARRNTLASLENVQRELAQRHYRP